MKFRTAGYSVLVVSQQNAASGVSIQDTAYALEAILQFVNSKRQAGSSKLVVLGYSLGGLTARYALADMEYRNIDHNAELYVSYDSPHRGANVPQGIQNIVPVMQQYLLDVQNAINTATTDMNNAGITVSLGALQTNITGFLDDTSAIVEQFGNSSIDSTIAKQLVIDNVNGTTERTSFLSNLATKGYPTDTVNIAITNGSIGGVQQPSPSLDGAGATYHFFGKKGANVAAAYLGANFALYPTVAGATNLTANFNWWFTKQATCVWGFGTCTFTFNGGVPKSTTTPLTVQALDSVPGSSAVYPLWNDGNDEPQIFTAGDALDYYTEIHLRPLFNILTIDHTPSNSFTFIPTFSALDIDVTDPSAAIDTGDSPFDEVYVNGDSNADIPPVAIADNVGHGIVFWPDDVVNKIAIATQATNEEKLLIWLDLPTIGYYEYQDALKSALGLAPTATLPRNYRYLASDMADYKDFTAPFTSLDELYELYPGEPTDMTPAILQGLVDYVENINVMAGLSRTDCVSYSIPRYICRKVP